MMRLIEFLIMVLLLNKDAIDYHTTKFSYIIEKITPFYAYFVARKISHYRCKIFLLLQSKKFFPLSIVLFFIFKKFFFTLLFRYKYI